MHCTKIQIGSAIVEVRCDFEDLIGVVEGALGDAGLKQSTGARKQPMATIIVRKASGLLPDCSALALALASQRAPTPPILSEGQTTSQQMFRFEDGVVYTYEPGRQRYRARVRESALGIIDFYNAAADWEVFEPSPCRTALHTLILDPISLLLPREQIMICHGAAVAWRGGATLIFGASGFGKSTLAFLLAHERGSDNIRILSDDTFVLDFTKEIVRVYPIHSGFGLSSDLVQRFGLREEHFPFMMGERGKTYFRTVPCQAFGGYPVHSIIFLDKTKSESQELERYQRITDKIVLNTSDTLKHLLGSQTSIPNPYMVERLMYFMQLSKQAPATLMRYADRCDLDALRDAIKQTHADPSAHAFESMVA